MQNEQIEKLLIETLTLSESHVSSEGTHYTVIAVGDCFDGATRVKKQQMVYAPLKDLISDGTMHAVSIKAFTPTQWQREKSFNLPT
ncbi:MAG: acid stress-induced BolA-like protein IbaG/YrbA [Alteromonadaceae bacterium]|jgi:acid stress-induced BolA-like protein IbaG/YrbA